MNEHMVVPAGDAGDVIHLGDAVDIDVHIPGWVLRANWIVNVESPGVWPRPVIDDGTTRRIDWDHPQALYAYDGSIGIAAIAMILGEA